MNNTGFFHQFIEKQKGKLIIQPRMGFADASSMVRGLQSVRDTGLNCIGTITLDSYTRVGNFKAAREAILNQSGLNGYPLVSYSESENRNLLDGLLSSEFPIQIRHGSPLPLEIFKSILRAGLDATEGGPISYCLPYSRTPLQESVSAWKDCCSLFADAQSNGMTTHIESFGGCMLGQLCPPSLLMAITILEGIFIQSFGVGSLSLSYAQGSNSNQDVGAILALRKLAERFLGSTSWHVVLYTFMGMFPESRGGAYRIIKESSRIAREAGARRLIVKTAAEAIQIPTIQDNISAMGWAAEVPEHTKPPVFSAEILGHRDSNYEEALTLVESVLNLDADLGTALTKAFAKGYLDVPYCLHPDNKKITRSYLDQEGRIRWSHTGKMQFKTPETRNSNESSAEFLKMLTYNRRKYDGAFEVLSNTADNSVF